MGAATTLDPNVKTNTSLSGAGGGANLLPGTAPTTGAGVSWNSGTGTATAASATDIVRWLNFLTVGKAYQATFNYTMSAGSKIRIANGLGGGSETVFTSAALSASGSVTANFTAVDVNFGLEADSAVFSGTISSIVIKETPLLIATSTGAGGARSSRVMSGPTYFEVTPTTLTGTPSVGIARSDWNTSTALQGGTNTLAYLATGAVQINGVTLATIAAWVQGNRIDVAVAPAIKQIWFRVASGNWNNNGSAVVSNDPSVAVGGIDFSTIIDGSLEAAIYASVTGNVWTTVFSSASFIGVPPTDFLSMDTLGYSAVKSVVNETQIPAGAPTSGTLVARPWPTDNSSAGKHFSPAGVVTQVSGIVQENSVVKAGCPVEVYDRVTGELLGRVLSAADGSWSLSALGRVSVRVVCSDPTTYNSLVYDNVVPV